jgi:hypothetical protein
LVFVFGDFMFSKKNTALFVSLIAFIFILSSCTNEQITPPDSNNEPIETVSATSISMPEETANLDNQNEGYPVPELEIQPDISPPGYPEPEVEAIPSVVDLTQPILPLQLESSETGATVGGVILDKTTQQARPESLVYLGNMQYTETGFPVISLDKQAAPLAMVSPNGAFIFQNVEPGEYALVFFTPDYSFLVEDEEEMSMILTVEEGDVLDLGTILLP